MPGLQGTALLGGIKLLPYGNAGQVWLDLPLFKQKGRNLIFFLHSDSKLKIYIIAVWLISHQSLDFIIDNKFRLLIKKYLWAK